MGDKKHLNDTNMYQFYDDLANNSNYLYEKVHYSADDENIKKYYRICLNKDVFDIQSIINLPNHFKNLQLLYDKHEVAEQLCMFDNLQRVFQSFFAINGIERLIATNYSDIEWSMFFEFDFEKNSSTRYRDHFKHQFRDAYLGFTLLYEFNIDKQIMKCIKERETVFAKYVAYQAECFKIELKGIEIENIDTDVFYRDIIFKSLFISSIFHDIGYPLAYFSRVSSQIYKYLPFYKVINSNIKADFVDIKAILADSLLFRTIDNCQIEHKYKNDDHGVLSAICLLLNFYNSGSIYNLSSLEKCIIEISARAIYNHTNKYEDDRMIFYDDPISYILRICDDLQEWSRFALSIGDNHNYMLCNSCLSALYSSDGKEYKCEGECGNSFDKITQLKYKKINYIDVCDEVTITEIDHGFTIKLEYDLYKQLEVFLLDPTYAIYRQKELNKVKESLKNQKYLPKIEMKWKLSNNPAFLIKEIFSKYVDSDKLDCDLIVQKIKDDTIDKKIVSYDYVTKLVKEIVQELDQRESNIEIYCKTNEGKKVGMCNYKELSIEEMGKIYIESEELIRKSIGVLSIINNCGKESNG